MQPTSEPAGEREEGQCLEGGDDFLAVRSVTQLWRRMLNGELCTCSFPNPSNGARLRQRLRPSDPRSPMAEAPLQSSPAEAAAPPPENRDAHADAAAAVAAAMPPSESDGSLDQYVIEKAIGCGQLRRDENSKVKKSEAHRTAHSLSAGLVGCSRTLTQRRACGACASSAAAPRATFHILDLRVISDSVARLVRSRSDFGLPSRLASPSGSAIRSAAPAFHPAVQRTARAGRAGRAVPRAVRCCTDGYSRTNSPKSQVTLL